MMVSSSARVRLTSLSPGARCACKLPLAKLDDLFATFRSALELALSGCWVSSVVLRVRAEGWSLRRLGSDGRGQADDLVLGGESGVHLVSVLDCGESVASGTEVR
jgi:hypothetical protein